MEDIFWQRVGQNEPSAEKQIFGSKWESVCVVSTSSICESLVSVVQTSCQRNTGQEERDS